MRRSRTLLVAALVALWGCGDGSGDGPSAQPDVELDQLTPRESPVMTSPSGPSEAPGEQASDTEPERTSETVRVGRSVEGGRITATVISSPPASENVLVVGCVHGDEPAGIAITEQLAEAKPPPGVALWLVHEFNPDGCTAGTRQNARGVDLNRNSPWHWRPLESPGATYYSGTGPLSEPESRAINALVTEIQPAITIWYHQHAELVDQSGGDEAIERRYAELVGLPYEFFGRFPGSITSWQNQAFPDDTAFVVELPAGELSPESVSTHAGAVLELARRLG